MDLLASVSLVVYFLASFTQLANAGVINRTEEYYVVPVPASELENFREARQQTAPSAPQSQSQSQQPQEGSFAPTNTAINVLQILQGLFNSDAAPILAGSTAFIPEGELREGVIGLIPGIIRPVQNLLFGPYPNRRVQFESRQQQESASKAPPPPTEIRVIIEVNGDNVTALEIAEALSAASLSGATVIQPVAESTTVRVPVTVRAPVPFTVRAPVPVTVSVPVSVTVPVTAETSTVPVTHKVFVTPYTQLPIITRETTTQPTTTPTTTTTTEATTTRRTQVNQIVIHLRQPNENFALFPQTASFPDSSKNNPTLPDSPKYFPESPSSYQPESSVPAPASVPRPPQSVLPIPVIISSDAHLKVVEEEATTITTTTARPSYSYSSMSMSTTEKPYVYLVLLPDEYEEFVKYTNMNRSPQRQVISAVRVDEQPQQVTVTTPASIITSASPTGTTPLSGLPTIDPDPKRNEDDDDDDNRIDITDLIDSVISSRRQVKV